MADQSLIYSKSFAITCYYYPIIVNKNLYLLFSTINYIDKIITVIMSTVLILIIGGIWREEVWGCNFPASDDNLGEQTYLLNPLQ